MSAFATGFKLGADAYNSGQDRQRQKVLDDRETEAHGQRQAQYQRQLGIQAKEDAAVGGLDSLERGVVPGGNWSTPEGYGADGPVPQNQQYDPGAGLKTRPASDKEYNQAFQRVALAKRDMAGLATLRTAGKDIDYSASILASNATWDKKTSEEKATLIKQHSYDQNIPGFGNWVPGKGKTEGYANFMPPNGDPMQLSNKEVRDFFSLTDAMQIDPVRARKEMDGVSDKVRMMAKEVFDTGLKASTEVNNTRKDQGMLAIQQQTADQQGEYQRGSLAVQRANAAQRGSGGGKQADPALVARNNELYSQFTSEPDPAKRKVIERQMQMVQTQIATSLGKTMQLPNSREDRPPVSNKDMMDFVKDMGASSTRVPDPTKPGKFLNVSQLPPALQRVAAQEFFGGAQGGDSGGGSGYKEIPPPPRGGSPAPNAAAPAPQVGGLQRPPSGVSSNIVQRAQGQLAGLNERIAVAEQQAQQVTRSGDVRSITQYGAALNDLRRQREDILNSVGPAERAYLN